MNSITFRKNESLPLTNRVRSSYCIAPSWSELQTGSLVLRTSGKDIMLARQT